jgi:hypothetical protein
MPERWFETAHFICHGNHVHIQHRLAEGHYDERGKAHGV